MSASTCQLPPPRHHCNTLYELWTARRRCAARRPQRGVDGAARRCVHRAASYHCNVSLQCIAARHCMRGRRHIARHLCAVDARHCMRSRQRIHCMRGRRRSSPPPPSLQHIVCAVDGTPALSTARRGTSSTARLRITATYHCNVSLQCITATYRCKVLYEWSTAHCKAMYARVLYRHCMHGRRQRIAAMYHCNVSLQGIVCMVDGALQGNVCAGIVCAVDARRSRGHGAVAAHSKH